MLDNIRNKFNLNKCIYLLILIIIVGLPTLKLLAYILLTTGIISDAFTINHVYLLWVSIPFLFIIYILNLIINKKEIDYLDIIIYFLIALSIVSTIFAVDKHLSIYGEYKRNEGLFSVIAYYLIFLLPTLQVFPYR